MSWTISRICIVWMFVWLCVALFVHAGTADGSPISFAVIGDFGGNESVARIVETVAPDFIVSTGDNNYGDSTLASPDWESQIGRLYGNFIQSRNDGLYPLQTSSTQRFFPTVGNHDVEFSDSLNGARDGYLDYFNINPGGQDRLPIGFHSAEQTYYDVRWGDVHLFSLDSQAIVNGTGADNQLAWLANAVAASDATWKFAFFHHPPYSSSQHGSHEAVQFPFAELGIDAVFSGHDHVYERIARDTNYFVVGAGGGTGLYPFRDETVAGSEFQYNEAAGALFASVTDDIATLFYLDVNANFVDRIEIFKEVPEPTTPPQLIFGLLVLLHRLRRKWQNDRGRIMTSMGSFCPHHSANLNGLIWERDS